MSEKGGTSQSCNRVVEWAPDNVYHQQFHPQIESQLLPDSPWGSPRSASGFAPGSFPMTASAMHLGVCEILCVPFKSGVSILYNPLTFLKVNSAGFQSQTFLRSSFCHKAPDLGLSSGFLLLMENLCDCNNNLSVSCPLRSSVVILLVVVVPSLYL
jgi:hypothetical protein